ncbi:ATPase [Bacillus thuringiensis]|uniref:PD-(D/E)XK nuclease family transposase n=1 Tax=Bacillus thuringiensis TaxID=1428 RepID=A0A9W3S755_BACTU|nr:Rpn family recombination-promoting nuclease/putative transposase [Bacillus thuringiensis]ANS46133.1 PD-(D/E)XK nuclease family transposase [Bacillus thuringiensis]MBH0340130.1 ATPase [Bacillus thuringiensis]MBH0340137.1 ATPase [Bacillus thuringiensis]MBH0340143.1 ATPase [Bacillus thuringiensis]MBH0340456.1 ATPase [Bacillus thuringiensis]
MKNLVNLRVDFAFKQLFGTKGNEDILMGFLNAVLQKSLSAPITSVSLEDPHLHKEYKEDKLSIMDVRATLETGEFVNVEVQIANKHDIQKRSLYYWSKLYASQMQEGMPYRDLQKAITINVLDFVLYPNHEYFQTTGTLWDKEKELCVSEDIEIHFIEMPKILTQWREEQVNPWQNTLVRWLLLLAANEDPDLKGILEEIAMERDETLRKAMDKWDNMSHNQAFRREYEAREKVLLDEKAAVAHAKAVGKEEGLEQGQAKIIKQMYESGMNPQNIADIVKLSVTEVQRILQLS